MQKDMYVTRMTLKEVCDIIGITIPEEYKYMENDLLTNIAYHTNFIQEGGLFFIRGKSKADVDEKIQLAINAKVKMVILEAASADRPLLAQIPHMTCEKPFKDVIKVSAKIRNDLGVKVIGVTGSLGKTTTKDVVHNVLSQGHNALKSLGNQNTIFPIFDNMQKMPEDTEYFVQEFGIKTPYVMPNVVRACVPDAGIITNISDPHVDTFGSKEGILKEKVKMLKRMPAGCPAFLNYDDELLKTVEFDDRPIISYAVDNKNADYYAENIEEYDNYMTFDIVHDGESVNATMYARGRFNVANALVAFAVGDYFGIPVEDRIKGIGEFKATGVRQNFTNVGGYKLFIDCYNTAPLSLVNAVEVLCKMPIKAGGRKIAVIADIYRLGHMAEELHTECGQKIGEMDVDLVYSYGNEYAKIMADEISKAGVECYYTADRDELNKWIGDTVTKKDIILFKGPVPRLLSKTIDQVFGTGLHIISEHYTEHMEGDYKARIIREAEEADKTTAAIMKYNGEESVPVIPSTAQGVDVFAIGTKAFFKNETITEANIPEPVFHIGVSAFSGCTNLKKVVLPATTKVIGFSAFRNCKQLETVVIPEGVTEIGNSAFRNCSNLKYIELPSTVGRIGLDAFKNTKGLIVNCDKNPEMKRAMRRRWPEKVDGDQTFIRKLKRRIKKFLKK